jgi:transposase InsO family protein
LCERVDAGRAICHVAAEAGIARQTLGKWYERWISEGEQGLVDRSSRPECSPNQTAVHIEDRVEALRRERKLGPVQLMGLLAGEGVEIAASTVYRILVRRGISRLRDLDVSGEDLREPVVRYEWARPGDMVHVDVKKLGRIPSGGGHRVHGRTSAQYRATRRAKTGGARAGYVFLHSALDDHSRLTYTEELPDELGSTAAGFWARAVKFFRLHGIGRIRRVLSDNGACYRSRAFAMALGASRSRQQRTRPYRPQTNGKIERFHRTLADGWAFKRFYNSESARLAALPAWIHEYNHHRPHSAIGKAAPITRLNNLAGHHS